MKPFLNEKGEKEIDVIPPTVALQIAGRAGRYGTQFSEGEVTTFKISDLPMLKKLLKTPVDMVEVGYILLFLSSVIVHCIGRLGNRLHLSD